MNAWAKDGKTNFRNIRPVENPLIKPRIWKFAWGWRLSIHQGEDRPENPDNKPDGQNEESLRFPPKSNERRLSPGTVRRAQRKSKPPRPSETD